MNSLLHKIVVFTLVVNTLTAGELSPRLVNVEFEVDGPRNKALKLNYDGSDFKLSDVDTGEVKTIRQYNLHRDLRELDTHRLRVLALNSYFVAREDGNGDYHLVHYPRLKGGAGPWTAWACEGVTRLVLWTLPFVLVSRMVQKTVNDNTVSMKDSELLSRGANTVSADVIQSYASDNICSNPDMLSRGGISLTSFGVNEVVAQVEKMEGSEHILDAAKLTTVAYATENVAIHGVTKGAQAATSGYASFVEFMAHAAYAFGLWLPLPLP